MPAIHLFRRSLKLRITAIVLLIIWLSMGLLTAVTSDMLRDDMERLESRAQFSTALLVAAQIDRELVYRLKTLEAIAGSIEERLLHRPADLAALVARQALAIRLFNIGIFVVNASGEAVAEWPVIGRVGVSYMDRDYVQVALKQGRAHFGNPVIGKLTRAPSFAMIVPIRNPAGVVVGAVAGGTDLGKHSFLDPVAEGHYGSSGGYLIVSKLHRVIVTASDSSRIMEKVPEPGANAAIDRFVNGHEGSAVLVNGLGVRTLASVVGIPSSPWLLAAVMPVTEAFAPVRAMHLRFLSVSLLLTLCACGAIWWWLNRQLSPMVHAANALAGADEHTQSLPIRYQDEIGLMISGFNRLLGILRNRDEAVHQLAFYDALTNLPNRRLLLDRLGQALANIRRNASHGGVIFLDLDHFKPLNDRYGHLAGDLLLIEVASRLKKCVRETDTVSRFGGDEYVVLIAELSADKDESIRQVRHIAEKIRVALEAPYVLELQAQGSAAVTIEHRCTASLGVALFTRTDKDEERILMRADAAMYRAKEAGRNVISMDEAV